jgi:hypothetical protein
MARSPGQSGRAYQALLTKLSRNIVSHRADLLHGCFQFIFRYPEFVAPIPKFIVLAEVNPASVLGCFGLIVGHNFSPLNRVATRIQWLFAINVPYPGSFSSH